MFESVLSGIISSAIIGLLGIVAVIIFIKPSSLNGEWILVSTVEKSDYIPFKDLRMEFKVHLILQGNSILGHGEKVKEIQGDGQTVTFLSKNRAHFKVQGTYSGFRLAGIRVNLHLEETGTERISSVYCHLKMKRKDFMQGTFRSTAANSTGKSTWIKVG